MLHLIILVGLFHSGYSTIPCYSFYINTGSSTGFLTSEILSAHIACGMRGDPNEDRNYMRCKIILKICKPSQRGASIAPQEPAPSTGTPGRAWELLCCLWFPVGEWGWALSDQLEKWVPEKARKASHAASTEGRAWDFHLKLLPASVLVGKMWWDWTSQLTKLCMVAHGAKSASAITGSVHPLLQTMPKKRTDNASVWFSRWSSQGN